MLKRSQYKHKQQSRNIETASIKKNVKPKETTNNILLTALTLKHDSNRMTNKKSLSSNLYRQEEQNQYQDQTINNANILSITKFLKQNQKRNNNSIWIQNQKQKQNDDEVFQKLQQLTFYLTGYIYSKNKKEMNMNRPFPYNDNTLHNNYSWNNVLQKVLDFHQSMNQLVDEIQQGQNQKEQASKFTKYNKAKTNKSLNAMLKNKKLLKQILQITIFFINEQKYQLNQLFSSLILKMIKLKNNLFSQFVQITHQNKNMSKINQNKNQNKNQNLSSFCFQFQAIINLKNILRNIFLSNSYKHEELMCYLFQTTQSKTMVTILAELSIETKSINKKTTILEVILQQLTISTTQTQSQNSSSKQVSLSQFTRQYLSKITRIMCQHILENSLSNQFQKEVCMASFAIISHLKSLFPKQVLTCFHSQNYRIISKIMKMCQEIDQNLYKTMKKYFSQIPFNDYQIKEFKQVKNQQIKEFFFKVKKKQAQLETLAKYIFTNQLKLAVIDYKLVLLLIIQFQSKDELIELRMLLDQIAKINDCNFSKAILQLLSSSSLKSNLNNDNDHAHDLCKKINFQEDEFSEMSQKMEDCHKLMLLQLLQQSMSSLLEYSALQHQETSDNNEQSYFQAVVHFQIFFQKQYTKQKRQLRYKMMKILTKLDYDLINKIGIIDEKYIKVSKRLKEEQQNKFKIKFF